MSLSRAAPGPLSGRRHRTASAGGLSRAAAARAAGGLSTVLLLLVLEPLARVRSEGRHNPTISSSTAWASGPGRAEGRPLGQAATEAATGSESRNRAPGLRIMRIVVTIRVMARTFIDWLGAPPREPRAD